MEILSLINKMQIYVFAQCGLYDITLTVTDDDGISDDTTQVLKFFVLQLLDS